MSKPCVVCDRIPAKEVFRVTHEVFKNHDKLMIHRIACIAVTMINLVDGKNRFFFCGKGRAVLIGGLLYVIAKNLGLTGSNNPISHELRINQRQIAQILQLQDITVARSSRRWLKALPELLTEVSA